jgi:hypothetical protein
MEFAPHTRTATLRRTSEGVVVIRIRPELHQALRDAEDNVAAGIRLAGGRRAPLVVDIREAAPLDVEVRHFYSGATLTDNFTAIAILAPTGAFGRMFGNIYLRVARPGIPAHLFQAEEKALEWARTWLP